MLLNPDFLIRNLMTQIKDNLFLIQNLVLIAFSKIIDIKHYLNIRFNTALIVKRHERLKITPKIYNFLNFDIFLRIKPVPSLMKKSLSLSK